MVKKGQSGEERTSQSKPVGSKDQKNETVHKPGQQLEGIQGLQQTVGNQAVQRLLAQRDGGGEFSLDEETAAQIEQARGSGQPLSPSVEKKIGGAMGQDFSDVRAHTSAESGQLNRQLGAKAFTTGQDIFFGEGEYRPHDSGGEELIAHELTHVVQQRRGMPETGPGMTVNAPGDAYEKEADAVAKRISEEELPVQRQEEEELMMAPVQRQTESPEEEELQTQIQTQEEEEEEEEMLQPARLQRQEEEELMMAPVQRQTESPEEEELQTKIQTQEEEEEMLQPARLQRQEEEELLQGKRAQRHDEQETPPA